MTEEQARIWIADILSVLARGAALSPTTLDDKAIQMAELAVGNDLIWSWLWTILRPVLEDGEKLVMAVASCPPEIEAEADKVEIDPLTILAIIKAIMDLIAIWRKRRA